MAAALAIPLITALIPEIPAIVADIKSLIVKHPALADPTAQAALIAFIVASATMTENAGLAAIDADQQAHPPALPKP